MKQPKNDDSHPDSNDLEGWRLAVKENRLSKFPLEPIVAAIQDLGVDSDAALIDALALYLSDRVMHILRRKVSKSYPNEGLDIIYTTHDQLIDAVLKPQSADGKALRKAFVPRLNYRLGDAIRAHERREPPAAFDDEVFDEKKPSVADLAYVEEILSRIVDSNKRLAFRLYMEDVPIKSNKTMSISETLGKSDKTIKSWIEEVKNQLKTVVEE